MFSFRKWFPALLLLVVSAFTAFGQGTSPDCKIKFTFTSATSSATFDNRSNYCSSWVLAYSSTGFTSTLALTVQHAPPSATPGTPGTWATFGGTVVSGINPNTSVEQGQTKLEGFYPYMRVNLASLTGTGVVTGTLYGYRYVASKVTESGSSGGISATVPYLLSGSTLYGPIFAITDPSLPTWAWSNQGDATLATSNGAQTLCAPSSVGAVDVNMRLYTAPATPYTVTALVHISAPAASFTRAGIGFRQSSTDKLATIAGTTGTAFNVDYWTNSSTYGSSPGTVNWGSSNGLKYLRITDNGTNLIFYAGESEDMLSQVLSASRTAHMLTTGPDQIFFFVNSNSSSALCIKLLSWSVT